MKRPAVFFDRDNTLIACDEYLGDASKVTLVNGAADAVARARNLGYATVIFSNQSGVARGYFSEEAVHAVNARLDELLADANPKAVIDRHEFCPFHPDASIDKYRQDSHLRKPRPGMIHQAAEALALDLGRSWVIGDAPRDIEAGRAAGCRTILFTDSKLKVSPAALAEKKVEPDYICSTLTEAMDFIARNTEHSHEEENREASEVSMEANATSTKSSSPSSSPPRSDASATTAAGEPKPGDPPRPLTSIEKLMARAQATSSDLPPIESVRPRPQPSVVATPAASESDRTEKPPPSSPPTPAAKLESIALDILHEVRRRHEQPQQDFSVSKLFAGITQVIVLALLFVAFLNRGSQTLNSILLFALTMQAMTIALLIMSRQR
ncbi:MAG: hypothetical protein QOF78_3663 [Phycisphaerales bacterium]|nr:hypothetical protein [Phycisphaerales bacterium]